MTDFDVVLHPRATDGRFTTRITDEQPGATLTLAHSPSHVVTKVEEILDMSDTIEGARNCVRELVPDVDDAKFDEQWVYVSQAEKWMRGFEDDPWLSFDEDAVGNSLVNPDDYTSINPADRACENGYYGLDYEQMGMDLAEQWRHRRRALIDRLVQA